MHLADHTRPYFVYLFLIQGTSRIHTLATSLSPPSSACRHNAFEPTHAGANAPHCMNLPGHAERRKVVPREPGADTSTPNQLSGYTKRSMVENAVYRYKAIIGPEMRARTLARQRVEHRIGCEILNKMAALGMPDTYCAG